jgi:GNAT superfamily N-acetyltransferase
MPKWNIESLEKAKPEDMRFLIGKLSAFNDAHSPTPYERRDIRLFVRDAAGEIIGGLLGGVSMHCLLIQILWVDASMRGQGLGTELVQTAFEIARAAGAQMAMVETTIFQAPAFYTRLGFETICEIKDSPIGSKTLLMLLRF